MHVMRRCVLVLCRPNLGAAANGGALWSSFGAGAAAATRYAALWGEGTGSGGGAAAVEALGRELEAARAELTCQARARLLRRCALLPGLLWRVSLSATV